jgi:mono/diheme cytochrome c family protein
MIRTLLLAAVLAGAAFAGVMAAAGAQENEKPNPNSWQIPEGAKTEVNPLQPTPANLEQGKSLYKKHCQKCHGESGKGDGPDADPDEMPDDLTDPKRAARNPDGVMFYKVWNGRKRPKMPAFKTELTKEEVWTVVNYAKTLRGT